MTDGDGSDPSLRAMTDRTRPHPSSDPPPPAIPPVVSIEAKDPRESGLGAIFKQFSLAVKHVTAYRQAFPNLAIPRCGNSRWPAEMLSAGHLRSLRCYDDYQKTSLIPINAHCVIKSFLRLIVLKRNVPIILASF